jgi:NAD(P)-dependent dehydrogenase (short-subunit alcohol dehydrogenase family)
VIVEVGSALAYRGISLQSAYCASKHAIQGLVGYPRPLQRARDDGASARMNTPQFSWVKSRLARKPQPVPPIYQLEVGAEAILFIARHAWREIYVGFPTVEATIDDKIAPCFTDKYLAKTAMTRNRQKSPSRRTGQDTCGPLYRTNTAHMAPLTINRFRRSPLL